jgi:hypothetical protein
MNAFDRALTRPTLTPEELAGATAGQQVGHHWFSWNIAKRKVWRNTFHLDGKGGFRERRVSVQDHGPSQYVQLEPSQSEDGIFRNRLDSKTGRAY